MKKLVFLILLSTLLVGSLILVGCGDTSTTTTTQSQTTTTQSQTTTTQTATATTQSDKYGGTFIFPLTVDPVKLGYGPENTGISGQASSPALEGLARNRAGGVLEPMLATDWEVAEDNSAITFHLREGVMFHDGSDFNAEVAKWNIDLYIEEGIYPDIASVDIIDEHTISVKVQRFTNIILDSVSGTQMISKVSFDQHGIEWARLNPIGTGAFIFESYERDAKITYKKNPNYWKPDKPYLDRVELVTIPDDTVRKIAFQNGEIHTIRALGLTAQELDQKGFHHLEIAGGTFALMPDSANPDSPLANRQVRQAISYAIDREALADSLGYGSVKPAYQMWPGFSAAIPDIEKIYDVDKAKVLLEEAGYPNGFKTTIYCFGQVVPKEYITALANMLGEIGIQTTPEFPEMGAYLQMYDEGWEGLLGHAYIGNDNLNYPFNFYFGPMSPESLAIPDGFQEAWDAALFSEEYDPLLMRKALQILYDDVTLIPYAEEIAMEFVLDGVHDTGLDEVLGAFILDETWLDPSLR